MDFSCGHFAGWTPLMVAASMGNTDFCQLLLSHGANANARTKTCILAGDITALCNIAISHRHHKIVFLLLDHEANLYDP